MQTLKPLTISEILMIPGIDLTYGRFKEGPVVCVVVVVAAYSL